MYESMTEWLVGRGELSVVDRGARWRPSTALEFFMDSAQLAFQDNHPLIEGGDGFLLCFAGRAGEPGSATDELDVSIDPLAQRLDA
jgi:hypothetical protein